MEYLRTRFQGMELVLRDLEEADIPALVEYWHDSDPGFLQAVGVDLSKITTREETRQRYLSMLPSPPGEERSRRLLVVADGERPLAYSNINIRSPQEAYAHAHILDPRLRNQGLASNLFLSLTRIYLHHFGVETLIFQTAPENEPVNRLLQRFGLTPRRVHMPQPDGMSRPGDFNLYQLSREQLAHLETAAAAGAERGSRPLPHSL